jgi:hypothetical protein
MLGLNDSIDIYYYLKPYYMDFFIKEKRFSLLHYTNGMGSEEKVLMTFDYLPNVLPKDAKVFLDKLLQLKAFL